MAKDERVRPYTMQRNYAYESHDADGKFNGLTEEQWKQQICDEWTSDNLKADYVCFIFHDKDKDDHGSPKPLHVHGCVYFKNPTSQSQAVELTGCSSDLNCKAINNKSQAYRYLLHITEQAIADEKHVYDEACLHTSVADGKNFDYHKTIKGSSKSDDDLKGEALIKQTVKKILAGEYGDSEIIYRRLPKQVLVMMGEKSKYDRQIHNAIVNRDRIHQKELYDTQLQQRANR